MIDYRQFRLSRLNEPQFCHLKMLLFWPAFGISFYALERLIPRMYHPVHCALDDVIPFEEIFLIPYLFWFVFLIGSHVYTAFADIGAFRRLMQFVMITYGFSLLIYMIWPTCQNLRPAVFPRDNVLTRFMAAFYAFDTNTNVCPSLHVCGSFAAAFAFTDTRRFSGKIWKTVIFSIAILISVSTVFVKQHSAIDMFCGLLLSGVAWFAVYVLPEKRNAKRPCQEGILVV